MKKIIAIFLIVMLAASLFACAKNELEATKSCASTHDFDTSTSSTTSRDFNASLPKDQVIYDCGVIPICEANGTASRKIIFTSLEDLLEYNSSEAMLWFIENFLWDEYFEECVLIGYYFEFDNEKYPLITKMDSTGNGDRICEVLFWEKGESFESCENLGYLVTVCATKEWLAKGKEITFSTEKIFKND